MTPDNMKKIEALASLVKGQTRAVRQQQYPDWLREIETYIRPGRRYTKIDRGEPGHEVGFLMIDHDTLEIFEIKGYGVPNKKKRCGTLDTIMNWYWGNYKPERYNE